MEVELSEEMNKKIADILSLSEDSSSLYVSAYIKALKKENDQLKKENKQIAEETAKLLLLTLYKLEKNCASVLVNGSNLLLETIRVLADKFGIKIDNVN